ncbi:recombinase family protein [Caballeronia sp. ATUFL_M1_KS5A]|uniref:recombinase family protein n=1 Tax=Caballeronia sp. ATUFL_M1_KS5A TaxID=2921778 RepID=UPI002028208E|nr:recombinase family protein [Caballeronia sp. ATUFL_M1_KS5A]
MPRSKKAPATPVQPCATARVYSYLRFSDIRQKAGTSVERQEEYAVKWAREHDMELDTSLTLRDEGLSAFHQKHVTQGALGVFLKAVNDGTVPPGSVLIVESLDRLSRADPIIAQNQLNSIVIAGVEVVTASDGMRYSLKTVKENSGILFMALGVMLRANEESAIKSKRIRAAAHRRCQNWIEGRSRERIAVGKNPGWVEFDESSNEFRLVPEFVTPLMALIGYFRAGSSMRRCFDQLQAAGIPLPQNKIDKRGKVKQGGLANIARLHEIIQNHALFGEKVVEDRRFAAAHHALPIFDTSGDLDLLFDPVHCGASSFKASPSSASASFSCRTIRVPMPGRCSSVVSDSFMTSPIVERLASISAP